MGLAFRVSGFGFRVLVLGFSSETWHMREGSTRGQTATPAENSVETIALDSSPRQEYPATTGNSEKSEP